jgi:hypothetical protein
MKGQVSTEFMIFLSVLIVILSVFLWSNLSLQHRMIGVKSDIEAQELCDKIAFEINSAVRAGEGYKRRFYVDESFFGVSDFSINIEEYSVFVDFNGNSVSSSIITKNITNGMKKGWNTIENINGGIHVS